jgi:hypothetical protein
VGHQLAGAPAAAPVTRALALVVAAAVLAACGGSDEAAPLDPAEIARQQAAEARETGTSPVSTSFAGTVAPTSPGTTVPADAAGQPAELPPPDPVAFVGANRVVNLWAGPGGTTQVVDVWARRTFTNGPVLLVEDLEFGEASEYVPAPANHSIVVVGADAGPDGTELAGVSNAGDGEQITTVFTNDDDEGTVWAPAIYERSPRGNGPPPDPPSDGNGLVYLYAPNTSSFESSLTLALGGAAFFVGDGSGACARQRIEDAGFAATVLGGTQHVQLDLLPGSYTLSLHPWPSSQACAQPSVLDVPVEVVAGGANLVLVSSRDGQSVQALTLPMSLS